MESFQIFKFPDFAGKMFRREYLLVGINLFNDFYTAFV